MDVDVWSQPGDVEGKGNAMDVQCVALKVCAATISNTLALQPQVRAILPCHRASPRRVCCLSSLS